jgi:hypothetical protein
MRIGSLVKFTNTLYREWGLGLILREYDMQDRNGTKHAGFYYVFTQLGDTRLVSDSFMEELSINPISS